MGTWFGAVAGPDLSAQNCRNPRSKIRKIPDVLCRNFDIPLFGWGACGYNALAKGHRNHYRSDLLTPRPLGFQGGVLLV